MMNMSWLSWSHHPGIAARHFINARFSQNHNDGYAASQRGGRLSEDRPYLPCANQQRAVRQIKIPWIAQ